MTVQRLVCPIQPYPWGSRTTLARLQGRPIPSPQPEAELWIGAHPAAPSRLGGVPLTERISADPDGMLGRAVRRRFGPRLPFLLKLLAAAEPLSLQAHPDPAQAAAGYAAEHRAGVPRDAPHRRYVDPHHKPELLVAVDEFRALCGFRAPTAAAELVDGLDVPELRPVVAVLAAGDLAAATRWLLSVRARPQPERARLVADAVAGAARALAPPYGLVGELAARYPDDPGVVVALLLNQVTLAPGEAIFMPAGNLHAYLSGTGVELMAASDNVLRGGLTSKHVDVSELLKVLRFAPLADPVLPAVPVADGVVTWPVPVPDFALYRVSVPEAARVELPLPGPRLLLCLAGQVRAADGEGEVTLTAGEAAFGPGGAAGPVVLAGSGQAYLASVGDPA